MLEEEGMSIAPPQCIWSVTTSQAPSPISGSQKWLENRMEVDVGRSESESDEDGSDDKEENRGDEEQDGDEEWDHNDNRNNGNDDKGHQEAIKQTGYVFPSFSLPLFR